MFSTSIVLIGNKKGVATMQEVNVDPVNTISPNIGSYVQASLNKKSEVATDKSISNYLDNVENIKPNKKYVSFREAHEFAMSLKLKTRKEWRIYVKDGLEGKPLKPSYIPAHPDGIYKVKGWQGWKYWLGTADKSLL